MRNQVGLTVTAAMAMLAMAGCGTGAAPASGSSPSAVGSTASTEQQQVQQQAQQQARQEQLKFPGTTKTVELSGYDDAARMVRFKLVVWQAGGADNGHYVQDPSDSQTHQLALAAAPDILSASEICSKGVTLDKQGHANQKCTTQQLVDALKAGKHPVAEIQVDQADHIARVSELYQP